MTLVLCALFGASLAATPLAPMPPPPTPKAEQAELGRTLFFDRRLTGDQTLACSTCHSPAKGWTDGTPLSIGYPGALGFRSTPTVMNVSHRKTFYWDGRLGDLADVVRDHIVDAQFMNSDGRLVIEKLRQVPEYESGFKKAFGGEPTFGRILNALVAFMQTLESKGDALDRHLGGDRKALSVEARAGLDLFAGKAGCTACHGGGMLTDEGFHRLGVPENPAIQAEVLRRITMRRFFKVFGAPGWEHITQDVGLYAMTKKPEDRGRFRTPSLREVGGRAAFMHNGLFRSLAEVVDFYDRGGGAGAEPLLKPLGLTPVEKAEIVAFLGAMKSPDAPPVASTVPKTQLRTLGRN